MVLLDGNYKQCVYLVNMACLTLVRFTLMTLNLEANDKLCYKTRLLPRDSWGSQGNAYEEFCFLRRDAVVW